MSLVSDARGVVSADDTGKVPSRLPIQLGLDQDLSLLSRQRMLAAAAALAYQPMRLEQAMLLVAGRSVSGSERFPGLLPLSLMHPLSVFLHRPLQAEARSLGLRSPCEFRALAAWQSAFDFAVDCGDWRAMWNVLLGMLSDVVGAPATIRSGRMFLRSLQQREVEMPSAQCACSSLQSICQMLVDRNSMPGLLQATVVHVGILNAHAFEDGNGRLARMVFNAVLRRAGLAAHCYVPIFEAQSHSRGGYEVRLREAEIFGDWNSLIQYFCNLIVGLAGRDDRRLLWAWHGNER
ncbi:Fic family protein [Pseudomarimonas arenosa]|uniref:Fic family protein n=1 Tax=Pseudomarimonas arenosa TaxID=2774145 RepID=A0AAW3ZVF1_9GAMM|nr:Fic family protein [Pseudomarimonas arenosa]MBD8528036.1 Fic family protein [Pseudomarimonas arenosa]